MQHALGGHLLDRRVVREVVTGHMRLLMLLVMTAGAGGRPRHHAVVVAVRHGVGGVAAGRLATVAVRLVVVGVGVALPMELSDLVLHRQRQGAGLEQVDGARLQLVLLARFVPSSEAQ